MTFSPRRVASVAFMPAAGPAPGTGSRPHERVHAHRERPTREPAPAFPDASRRLRTNPARTAPRPAAAAYPRHVERRAAERVAGVELPLAAAAAARLACSHPTNARATARWSEPPPASSENPRRAARPALSAPVHGHDERGSVRGRARNRQHGIEDSSKVAYRSILPTRGCTGISPVPTQMGQALVVLHRADVLKQRHRLRDGLGDRGLDRLK